MCNYDFIYTGIPLYPTDVLSTTCITILLPGPILPTWINFNPSK